MIDDIKIGDKVKLLHDGMHNSDIKKYDYKVSFKTEEIGCIIEIIDIEEDKQGDFAYKVKCNLGITYLRRSAFELVYDCQPEVQSLDSLINLLKQAV